MRKSLASIRARRTINLKSGSGDLGQSVLHRLWQTDRHKEAGRVDGRLSGFVNHSCQVIFVQGNFINFARDKQFRIVR